MGDQFFNVWSSTSNKSKRGINDINVTPCNELDGQIGEGGSNETTLLPEDYVLDDNDVLYGRGSKCFNHEGNRRFRQLVQDFLPLYANASNKKEKTLIIHNIIDSVRNAAAKQESTGKGNAGSGVGFVKHDPLTGRYYGVGDSVAREKASQAFRDAVHGTNQSMIMSNLVERKHSRISDQSDSQKKSCKHDTNTAFPSIQIDPDKSKPDRLGLSSSAINTLAARTLVDVAVKICIENPNDSPCHLSSVQNKKLKIQRYGYEPQGATNVANNSSIDYAGAMNAGVFFSDVEAKLQRHQNDLNYDSATSTGVLLSKVEERQLQQEKRFPTIEELLAGSDEFLARISDASMPNILADKTECTKKLASYQENSLALHHARHLPHGKINLIPETAAFSSSNMSNLASCPTVDAAMSNPHFVFQFPSMPNKKIPRSASEPKKSITGKSSVNYDSVMNTRMLFSAADEQPLQYQNNLNYNISDNVGVLFSNVVGRQQHLEPKSTTFDELLAGCNSSDAFLSRFNDSVNPKISAAATECTKTSFPENSMLQQNAWNHLYDQHLRMSREQHHVQQKQQEHHYPGQDGLITDQYGMSSSLNAERELHLCAAYNPHESAVAAANNNSDYALSHNLICIAQQQLEYPPLTHCHGAVAYYENQDVIDNPFEPRPI